MNAFWKGLSRKAKTYIVTGSAAVLLLIIIIIIASCSGGGGSVALSPKTASYQQLCQAAVGQTYEGYTITAVQPYVVRGQHTDLEPAGERFSEQRRCQDGMRSRITHRAIHLLLRPRHRGHAYPGRQGQCFLANG